MKEGKAASEVLDYDRNLFKVGILRFFMTNGYTDKRAIEMLQRATGLSREKAKIEFGDFMRRAEAVLNDPNTEYVPLEKAIEEIERQDK